MSSFAAPLASKDTSKDNSSALQPSNDAHLPVADAARVLEPGARYWLGHQPDLGAIRPLELGDELAQVNEWLGRQTASTPEVLRMEKVRAQMQARMDQLGGHVLQEPKKTQRRKSRRANQADKAAPAEDHQPRTLREHSSVSTDKPGDLAREYDDIVEGLQDESLSSEDRRALQTELALLSPAASQELGHRAAQRQAQVVSGALANGPGTIDTTFIGHRLDSVRPLEGHPGWNYLMNGHEKVLIPDAQLQSIRTSVMATLESQAEDIHQDTEDLEGEYAEFVDRTYNKHTYVGALSMIGSGENPLNWDAKFVPLIANSNNDIGRFRDLRHRAQDPWGDHRDSVEAMARAVQKADVQATGARYQFESRRDAMFEATASQVKVLEVAKAGGQIAAGIAFSPAGAALYSAVEDSAVQGMEIHYGQRESFDYGGVLINAGASYFGGKLGSGVTSLAGKEASALRRGAFTLLGDRAGAVATTGISMGANNLAGRTDYSLGDFYHASKDELLNVPQTVENMALGKVHQAAHRPPGGAKLPSVPHSGGGSTDAPVAKAPQAGSAVEAGVVSVEPTHGNTTPSGPPANAVSPEMLQQMQQIVAQSTAKPQPAASEITTRAAGVDAPITASDTAGKTTAPTPPVVETVASRQKAASELAQARLDSRTMTQEQWKDYHRDQRADAQTDRAFEQLERADKSNGIEVPKVKGKLKGKKKPRIDDRSVPGPRRNDIEPNRNPGGVELTDADIQQFPKPEDAKVGERILDQQHVPRRPGESWRDAKARVGTVIGHPLSDYAFIEKLWNEARSSVESRNVLTEDNHADLYEKTRKAFWRRVRGDSAAAGLARQFFDEAGFHLPTAANEYAARLTVDSPWIFEEDVTVSLDHALEKARHWEKSLDADNLIMLFSGPNSDREIKQSRHPSLRSSP